MSITIKQGLSGRYLSRNIPDLEVGCTGDRLGVKIAVDATEVFSETLFPVDGLVELADLGDLLTPYARKSLVASVEVTLTEGDASASLTTQKQTFEVVYCEADVPTGCEDFTKNHFLSLLLGVKVTGMGRLEYLHYAGTEEASVTARYDDGTEKTFELDPVGGNGRYTTIEVSPAHFAKEGAELMGTPSRRADDSRSMRWTHDAQTAHLSCSLSTPLAWMSLYTARGPLRRLPALRGKVPI